VSIREIWFYANNIINSARQIVNEKLGYLNLGSAEGNILLHLLTSDAVLRQEDLAEQLEISKPAISRALVSLEEKGYVARRKDPGDLRVRRVFLTEKARRIGAEIEEAYDAIFALASEGLSPGEIAIFIELFSRVSDNFVAARKGKEEGESGNGNK